MCKKLIFSAFVLAMVMLAVPASAQMTYPENVMLKVDIDDPDSQPGQTQTNWTSWTMPSHWGPFGPVTKNFGFNPTAAPWDALPIVTLNGISRAKGANQLGGARTRYAGTDMSLGKVHQDLVYVAASGGGLGYDYLQLDFSFGPGGANQTYEFTFWGYDPAFEWAGETPNSKYVAWSTTNPATWLAGYLVDPNGYAPGDMPAGLEALLLDRALAQGSTPDSSEFDGVTGMTYSASFEVTLDGDGKVTIYGWQDMTDWSGSQHVPLNGFAVGIPEPATVALLGLGGLALLRRRRR